MEEKEGGAEVTPIRADVEFQADFGHANHADQLIAERAATHGDYERTATIIQQLKAFFRQQQNWKHLTAAQRESMDSIAVKMARIFSGDPDEPDHWDDIEGYARLGKPK